MIFREDVRRYGKIGLLNQPALWAIGVYRFGRWTLSAPLGLRKASHFLYFLLYSSIRLITGVDIPRSVQIGPGLMIHHFGGVVFHPQVVAGSNLTLRQGVTIGQLREHENPPVIGSNVNIGAYAQILGNIVVEDNVTVGALSLLKSNAQKGRTYVGIPAKPVN